MHVKMQDMEKDVMTERYKHSWEDLVSDLGGRELLFIYFKSTFFLKFVL